ncbi:MAG TPA: spore germination protein, partial [Clostridia bacterium]|nr:spore germination protein [Clostridia bacterium]
TRPFTKDLANNLKFFEEIFERCSDINYRSFELRGPSPLKAVCIYVPSMIDKEIVNNHVLKPLMTIENTQLPPKELISHLKRMFITSVEVEDSSDIVETVEYILSGNVALLIDGYNTCLIVEANAIENRCIKVPPSEQFIRGPRDVLYSLS